MIDPYKEVETDVYESIQEKLSTLNYTNISIEEIFELIKPLRNGLPMEAIFIGSSLIIFRGVKWDDKPQTIDNVSYPPKQFAKTNRASQEGEQLFYSSTSKNICLYEMDAKKGDRIAISEWRTKVDLIFPLIGYTENNLRQMGTKRILDFGEKKFVHERFSKNSAQQINIIEYLAKTFCQPINSEQEDKYKLTIAIARLFCKEHYNFFQKYDGRFAGITYPSIKGSGNHDNYAINIDLLDTGLVELNKVEYIEIVDYDSKVGKYQYKITDSADSPTGNQIPWKDVRHTWTIWDDQEIVFDESNPVQAFTVDGEEYFPD